MSTQYLISPQTKIFGDKKISILSTNFFVCCEIRDGGDRTPGYGSEDRRVAITPHP